MDSADNQYISGKPSWIVIPAEVDARKGNFALDMGTPFLMLNRTFLQPTPAHGVDTVPDVNAVPERTGDGPSSWDSVDVTMRIGTMINHFNDPVLDGSKHTHVNALLNHMWENFTRISGFGPILGNIGLAALEPFETIIDYTHKRVVLIRLDKAGHRLVDVPAYTPTWSAPLLDIDLAGISADYKLYAGAHFWGVQALLGGTPDSLAFDTEMPFNMLRLISYSRVTTRLTHRMTRTGMWEEILDSMTIAGRVFDSVSVSNMTSDGSPAMNLLGYPFLRERGIVGFNHRTHQFLLYAQ